MIVVKIELWPRGDKSKAKNIGTMTIINDGTGNTESANYEFALSHSGKYFNKPGIWKSGKLCNHNRNLSPYHLVMKCLRAVL